MVKVQNFVIWMQLHIYVKTGDIYKGIAEDVEKRFDTYHYLYL